MGSGRPSPRCVPMVPSPSSHLGWVGPPITVVVMRKWSPVFHHLCCVSSILVRGGTVGGRDGRPFIVLRQLQIAGAPPPPQSRLWRQNSEGRAGLHHFITHGAGSFSLHPDSINCPPLLFSGLQPPKIRCHLSAARPERGRHGGRERGGTGMHF